MGLGLRRVVLCPGSRSAPLALAASRLESQGLALLTCIDERSAAFFALGQARADGKPTAVITTSGTAVANLLPAAVEADFSTLPLLFLTADRPERLKACGSNQTVNQEAYLQPACRALLQGPAAGLHLATDERLSRLAQSAMRHALGTPAGPVHLNVSFDEPLHASVAALPPAASPPAQELPSLFEPPALESLAPLDPDQPGVIVVGPWRRGHGGRFVAALQRLNRRTGWPILADAASGLRGLPLPLISGYDLLLANPDQLPAPSQVLRLGSMAASRRLQQWLDGFSGPQLVITEAEPRRQDPLASGCPQHPHGLAAWVDLLPDGQPSALSRADALRWDEAETLLQQELDQQLIPQGPCNEPGLARALQQHIPSEWPVMLASSSPVRDWESYAGRQSSHRTIVSFRGASGIDGTLSLACGMAHQWQRLVLVTGDLALLHDANGWLWRRSLAGQLRIVLIDNAGGGVFEQLPIPRQSLDFDRLFAMPQSCDAMALAAAHGVAARECQAMDTLAEQLNWLLEPGDPMRLLRCSTDRSGDALLRQQLRERPWWEQTTAS